MRDHNFLGHPAKAGGEVFHLLSVGGLFHGTLIDVQERADTPFIRGVLFFERRFEGRGSRRADYMDLGVVALGSLFVSSQAGYRGGYSEAINLAS
jgi:hypothetical protein